jgi:hypothetical protein
MGLASRSPALVLGLLASLFACSDDDFDAAVADAAPDDAALADAALADGGPCDAAPLYGCVPDCADGEVCVAYESESGWSSCNDREACVSTTFDCPPGTCTADCETALCPDPYSCVATEEGQLYTCSKP